MLDTYLNHTAQAQPRSSKQAAPEYEVQTIRETDDPAAPPGKSTGIRR